LDPVITGSKKSSWQAARSPTWAAARCVDHNYGECLSQFSLFGFDNHPASIANATEKAQVADVIDRVSFEVAAANDYQADNYDLICFLIACTTWAIRIGAMRMRSRALSRTAAVLIVEPMAGNTVEENFNIIGRTFSGHRHCAAPLIHCYRRASSGGGGERSRH
jgi:23S rRNA G2445 N2-methylase RlmL